MTAHRYRVSDATVVSLIRESLTGSSAERRSAADHLLVWMHHDVPLDYHIRIEALEVDVADEVREMVARFRLPTT